ncbi:hypothetical protein ACFCWB_11480 [Streptomyces bacillaris]|uniref:hypothetical protein n=1 Tax=Streptomyces bacillaris TaxID=68179 RepID=UPI0035D9B0E6
MRHESFHRLLAALTAAQKQRDQRAELVDGPDRPECEWVAFERSTMHQVVNDIRAEHSLPPIPPDAVIRVERLAAGHSDYSQKFAFHCAELAAK